MTTNTRRMNITHPEKKGNSQSSFTTRSSESTGVLSTTSPLSTHMGSKSVGPPHYNLLAKLTKKLNRLPGNHSSKSKTNRAKTGGKKRPLPPPPSDRPLAEKGRLPPPNETEEKTSHNTPKDTYESISDSIPEHFYRNMGSECIAGTDNTYDYIPEPIYDNIPEPIYDNIQNYIQKTSIETSNNTQTGANIRRIDDEGYLMPLTPGDTTVPTAAPVTLAPEYQDARTLLPNADYANLTTDAEYADAQHKDQLPIVKRPLPPIPIDRIGDETSHDTPVYANLPRNAEYQNAQELLTSNRNLPNDVSITPTETDATTNDNQQENVYLHTTDNTGIYLTMHPETDATTGTQQEKNDYLHTTDDTDIYLTMQDADEPVLPTTKIEEKPHSTNVPLKEREAGKSTRKDHNATKDRRSLLNTSQIKKAAGKAAGIANRLLKRTTSSLKSKRETNS